MIPRSLSATLAFERVRFLATVGWSLSPRALIWSLAAVALFVGLAAFTAGFVVFSLLRALGAEQFISPSAVIVGLYVLGSACLREIFGPRRLMVQANPNQALFRALDIEKCHYFLVQAAPRSCLIGLITAAFSASALGAISSNLSDPLIAFVLISTPLAFTLTFLAASARLAVSNPKPLVVSQMMGAGIVSAVALSVPAYWIARFLAGDSSLPALPPLPSWWSLGTGVAVVALASGSAFIIRRSWVTMSAHSFSLPAGEKLPARGRAIRHGAGALWTSLLRSRYRRMIANVSCLLTTGAAVAVALRLGGFHAEDLPLGRSAEGFLPWLAVMVGITVADLISRDNGAAVLAPRLRYLWEGGAEAKALVAVLLGAQIAFAIILASPGVLLIGWALTGDPFWSSVPIIAAAVAATLLGGSVSRTTVGQADGTAETSLAAALLTFVAAAPAGVLALMPGLIGLAGSSLYTLALIGVAALCLRRRILRLPLSLQMSPPATSRDGQS